LANVVVDVLHQKPFNQFSLLLTTSLVAMATEIKILLYSFC